jgi:uncharacterized membrane protein
MSVFIEFLFTFAFAFSASVLTYLGLKFLSSRRTEKRSPTLALREQWIDRTFFALVASYTLGLGTLTLLRYYSFSTPTTDLSQYDQLIWNSLCGRLLENSYIPDAPQFLGKSFSPILLALVPLYTLWSSPVTLLIIQTLALAVASFPIYWFARERLGRPLALAIAAAYFLFPAVWYSNLDEFHEIVLAVPLLAFTTYFLLHRHYKGFLTCLAVTLLVKEEIAFVAVGFGAFIFLFQNKKALGLGIAVLAGALAVALLAYITPFFRGAQAGDFYYFGSGTLAGGGGRYAYLGHSLSQVVLTLFTQPAVVLPHILIPAKIEYLVHLLVPVAFLPLIGTDVAILMLPSLGYTLLSDYSWQYNFQTAYPAPLVPFVFFSAIMGSQRILAWRRATSIGQKGKKWSPYSMRVAALAVLVLASSGVDYLLQGAGPVARNFQAANYAVSSGALLQEAQLRSIPHDAVVVAQNEFLAHVSNRQVVHEIPVIPDYRQADYLVYDDTRAWYDIHSGFWNRILDTGYFEPLFEKNSFVIAGRRVLDNTHPYSFGGQFKLLGYAVPLPGTVQGNMIIRPILNWQAIKGISDRYSVTLQVVDSNGHVWASADVEPRDGLAPTLGWQPGMPLTDQYTLKLPPTMPRGDYQVTVGLHKLKDIENLAILDEQGRLIGSDAVITTLQVGKNKNSFTAGDLQIEQPLFVDMQEIRLLGYVPTRETLNPGELLHVGVYWRARAQPQGDYDVSVQLLDANGHIAFERTSRPANGTYPTTQWSAGEVLLDWHDFVVPLDLAKGSYVIAVELRNVKDGSKLGAVNISTILIGKN